MALPIATGPTLFASCPKSRVHPCLHPDISSLHLGSDIYLGSCSDCASSLYNLVERWVLHVAVKFPRALELTDTKNVCPAWLQHRLPIQAMRAVRMELDSLFDPLDSTQETKMGFADENCRVYVTATGLSSPTQALSPTSILFRPLSCGGSLRKALNLIFLFIWS